MGRVRWRKRLGRDRSRIWAGEFPSELIPEKNSDCCGVVSRSRNGIWGAKSASKDRHVYLENPRAQEKFGVDSLAEGLGRPSLHSLFGDAEEGHVRIDLESVRSGGSGEGEFCIVADGDDSGE